MVIQGKATNKRILDINDGNYGREGFTNNYIDKIQETFTLSPSYFQVTKNNDTSILYDAWITEIKDQEPKDGVEKKNLIFYPNQSFEKGDYIYSSVLDKTFLVMSKPPSPYYDNGEMWVCNNQLKFKNKSGNIVNYYCIVTILGRMYLDVTVDKELILPKDTFELRIQKNEDTKDIIESQRFIINNKAFKVMALTDILINNILQIKLQSDPIRDTDDLINGIASQNNGISPILPSNSAIQCSNADNTIKINNQAIFTVLNANVGQEFSWQVLDAITNLPTTNASIVSTPTVTSCVVKANVSGKQIKIVATDVSNSSNSASLIVNLSAGF